MRIFGVKIPKKLQGGVALLILGLLAWLYKNLALISIIISIIVFLVFFFIGLSKVLNLDNYFDNTYGKIIGTLLIILSFIPGYFGGYMILNYDESNKYLQEKSFEGFIQIGQFAVKGRSFTVKNILKEVETNMIEDLKQKAVVDTLNNLGNNTSTGNLKIPIIEPNVSFESGALKLNPEIKFTK